MILRVRCSSLSGLFEATVILLSSVLVNSSEVGETLREKIVVEGANLDALLCAWANALFALAKQQSILACRGQVLSIDEKSLRADVFGELVDAHRHSLKGEGIGAICLSATVTEKEGFWRAELTITLRDASSR